MTQQLNEMQIAEAVGQALEFVEDEISLLELTKKAVPNLSEDTIRRYINFIVNGKKVTDADTIVTRNDSVEVLPCFAGGF